MSTTQTLWSSGGHTKHKEPHQASQICRWNVTVVKSSNSMYSVEMSFSSTVQSRGRNGYETKMLHVKQEVRK